MAPRARSRRRASDRRAERRLVPLDAVPADRLLQLAPSEENPSQTPAIGPLVLPRVRFWARLQGVTGVGVAEMGGQASMDELHLRKRT